MLSIWEAQTWCVVLFGIFWYFGCCFGLGFILFVKLHSNEFQLDSFPIRIPQLNFRILFFFSCVCFVAGEPRSEFFSLAFNQFRKRVKKSHTHKKNCSFVCIFFDRSHAWHGRHTRCTSIPSNHTQAKTVATCIRVKKTTNGVHSFEFCSGLLIENQSLVFVFVLVDWVCSALNCHLHHVEEPLRTIGWRCFPGRLCLSFV